MQTFLNFIETELDYKEFIDNEGLIVLDVYSEWCGPCFSMIKYIREVFMDYLFLKHQYPTYNLHIALCKVNNIPQLSTFTNNSEPTWIFLMVCLIYGKIIINLSFFIFLKNKEIVQVIYGSNAIKLTNSIKDRLFTE